MIRDFFTQTLKGKSIYRVLFQWQIKKHCGTVSGRILDLGGGKMSYTSYLSPEAKVEVGDITTAGVPIDFNVTLPFADETFDGVFIFNALYIARDTVFTLKEIRRILKKEGVVYIASPFISNEMPEPHDYVRYTAEGLQMKLQEANFSVKNIERFGERFTSAAYLLHPFFVFGFIRCVVNGVCMLFDMLIPRRVRQNHPTPLGYFVTAQK